MQSKLKNIVDIIAKLRHPTEGCPWDNKQTHSSLKKFAIEEAYELSDAIDSGEDQKLKDELGDVLLQVLLHSQIAKDRGAFDLGDVIESLSAKLIRRHPHVFGDAVANTPEEVEAQWARTKRAEREEQVERRYSCLDGVNSAMPSLMVAHDIGERVKKQNFEWHNFGQVWDDLLEEIDELRAELPDTDYHELSKEKLATLANRERISGELGDILFSLSQVARWLAVDSEMVLREANRRFSKRFRLLESYATKPLPEYTVEEMMELWERAKREEHYPPTAS